MQTYKHAEVKKLRKGFREISFNVLIGELNRMVKQPIRACYEMYLDMDDESLACIIGLFPFELLCCYGIIKGDLVQSEFFLHELVESSRRRLARVTALRDAMVLENQIPVLTVQVILKIEICSEKKGESHAKDDVTERFPLMSSGFCKAVSPPSVLSVTNFTRPQSITICWIFCIIWSLSLLRRILKKKSRSRQCSY